jgi:hypothetical protein
MTRKRLVNEYAGWLSSFKWELFATLTFESQPTRLKALRLFKQWLDDIQKETNAKRMHWVCVTETGAGDQHLHLHVVLGGLPPLDLGRWSRHWRTLAGRAYIERFDPKKGGLKYLLKSLLIDDDSMLNFDLGVSV